MHSLSKTKKQQKFSLIKQIRGQIRKQKNRHPDIQTSKQKDLMTYKWIKSLQYSTLKLMLVDDFSDENYEVENYVKN